MPSIPKFIGDFMELALGNKICRVNVESVHTIAANLKAITFKGVFLNVNFKIGQAVIIRVDPNNYRNYTPCCWDSQAGTFQVIFHIHGNGPGSRFIEELKVGDQVTVGLPRGFEIYKKQTRYHFLFGDETCISVFQSLKNEINHDDNDYIGILEVDKITVEISKKTGLMLDTVLKTKIRAESAIENLNKLDPKIWDLWKDGQFYLMGNAKSIQNFRKALKDKGVNSKNITTQPFWADGKTGL